MPGILSPGSTTSYNIAPGQSQADLDLKKKIAMQLMAESTSGAPVQSWTQALARGVQGALGGYGIYQANQEDMADRDKARGIIQALSGGASAPVPPTTPANAPVDPTAPRGFRNNNPLNIESGSFTQGQPGYTGTDGRFAQFSSMDQGQAAADKLLQSYGGKGINTVSGIVNRWAPPSDNNPTDTYAATVAKAVGVDPNAPVNIGDPAIRQKIIAAMAQFENGRALPTGSAPASGPAPGMAPVGAPVDQPRGGMGDDRRQQLIGALSQTRAGAPFAQALFAKELDREANRTRPLTDTEKQTYPGAVAIEASGKPVFPPPSTNVSLNAQNSAESAYSKGKAEDALGLERSADKTIEERQRVEVFRNLVNNFKTGKLAPGQATVGAWADALGFKPETFGVAANAAMSGQLIEQMSNQMTLGMIGNKAGEGGMPANNFSDADRKFLSKATPGLANLPGSNEIMLDMKGRALDRHLEKVSMWDDYRSNGKSYEVFERDWRKHVNSQPSLFADIPDKIKQLSAAQGAQIDQNPAAAAVPSEKTINGKTYFKQGNQWFEK